MKFFKKKSAGQPLTKSRALALSPVRNLEISQTILPSGNIVVQYPVTLRPWMAKWMQRFRGPSPQLGSRKLQLDDLGSEVWKMIDGKRTVQDIVNAFAGSHQIGNREAETAVTQFLRELGKRGVIGLKE
jgi:hypothetical protein